MDALMQDQNLIQQETMRAGSITELLGATVDSSVFRSAKTNFMGNDILNISVGNLDSVSDQSVTIALRPQISNALLDLKSWHIICKYKNTAPKSKPVNYLALFRPLAIKYGNFTKNYAYGEMLTQQVLELKSASQISAYRHGLGIGDLESFDEKFQSGTGGAGSGISPDENAKYPFDNATEGFISAWNYYLAPLTILGDNTVAIPVMDLFAYWGQSVDYECFIKYPGQLEVQLQTVPKDECIVSTQSLASALVLPTQYTLSNFYTFYQYTRLNDTVGVMDKIMNSIVEYHPKYSIPFQASMSSASSTVTLNFSASPKQRIHQLLFACHPNSSIQRKATALAGNKYYGENSYQGEIIMFPAFQIKQLTLDISGQVITLNSQAISALQLLQGCQSSNIQMPYYEGGYAPSRVWRNIRCPYTFDLSRFYGDEVGSSTGTSQNIIVQIFFGDQDLSVYGNQSTGAVITAFGSYNVYGFIICSSKMELKQGNVYEV